MGSHKHGVSGRPGPRPDAKAVPCRVLQRGGQAPDQAARQDVFLAPGGPSAVQADEAGIRSLLSILLSSRTFAHSDQRSISPRPVLPPVTSMRLAFRMSEGNLCIDPVEAVLDQIGVHLAVPAVWPAAVSPSPHAPAKRNGSGTAGFPGQGTLARVPGDQRRARRVSGPGDRQGHSRIVYKNTGDAEEVAEPEKLGR